MRTFLVIGGSGKTGRRVVERLGGAGHEARSASRRSPATPFDWSDAATHAAAVAGAEGVFLTVAGQDPANAERVAGFLDTAAGHGVGHAVLLSARAVEFHPQGALAAVEQAVAAAPLSHTILRPSWFAQNFTEAFLAPDDDGVVSAPTGDGREPFIDLEDLAEVAATVLTRGEPKGTIALSGSEALSFGEAVGVLAQAGGRPLRFEAADPARYRAALEGELPSEYVAWRMAMFDAIRDGRDAYLSDGVERVLGRPARGFRAWAAGR